MTRHLAIPSSTPRVSVTLLFYRDAMEQAIRKRQLQRHYCYPFLLFPPRSMIFALLMSIWSFHLFNDRSKRSHWVPRYRHLVPIGSLSKDVFERRTSTGSESFSSFICLDANKFVLLSFFSLIKTIYPRVSTKPPPNDAKSPLPVDVRRSQTL